MTAGAWASHPDRAAAERLLTARQLLCYRLMVQGLSLRATADTLDLSVSTVRDHLDSAHRKLRRAQTGKEAA